MIADWAQFWVLFGTGVVLFGTLVISIFQIRALNRSVRSESYRGLKNDVSAWNNMLLEKPQVSVELFADIIPSKISMETITAANMLFDIWASLYYLHHHYKTIDKSMWKLWQSWINDFGKRPVVQKLWQDMKHWYAEGLQDIVGNMKTEEV